MDRTWFEILALYALVLLLLRALYRMPGAGRVRRPPRRRLRTRARRRRRTPGPVGRRPVEVVAEELRRRADRYRHAPRGTSWTKLEALRHAYDQSLAEACACLGIEHLLLVLPPGEELDRERRRVEESLWVGGLRFEEAA